MNIYFAPLQGYTDAIYRNTFDEIFGHITQYYTPFIRLEKGEVRLRDLKDIAPGNNTVAHLIPQLIGKDHDQMAAICRKIQESGYNQIDINMGCPFPLITKKHKGAGILPYPDQVKSYLSAIAEFPDITFSIKMRLGMVEPSESIRLLPLLNQLPLSHITLHPRVGKQQYKGSTDMGSFALFMEQCQMPIVYNGDLRTVEQIRQVVARFPNIKAIMIGRGLLADPFLALEYQQGTIVPLEQKREKLEQFHSLLFERYAERLEGGDHQILSKLQVHWDYLLPNMEKRDRKLILKSSKLTNYMAATNAALRRYTPQETECED